MAQSAPQDEPTTPMWLPALGALLFLSAGIWWATRPGDPPAQLNEATVDAGAEAAADAGTAAPPTH